MHITVYAYLILQKNALKPKTPPAQPSFTPAQLLIFFVRLLPHRALRKLPALRDKDFYNRLFSPLVTLWYLLFQRLNSDHSLEGALSDARTGGGDRVKKKISHQPGSGSTGPFTDGRPRPPLEFL